MLALTLAAAMLAVVLGGASSASASKASCAGSLSASEKDPENGSAVKYSFLCDRDVLAYSLSFNKQMSVFEPEVLPSLPSGDASGELVSCEGSFPGAGIGCTAQSSTCPGATSSSTVCTGRVAAGNTVESEVEMVKPYCPQTRRKRTLEGYLTVATEETNANGKSFVITSQPFHLDRGLKCPKPTKTRS